MRLGLWPAGCPTGNYLLLSRMINALTCRLFHTHSVPMRQGRFVQLRTRLRQAVTALCQDGKSAVKAQMQGEPL